jgi:hypothetical protein
MRRLRVRRAVGTLDDRTPFMPSMNASVNPLILHPLTRAPPPGPFRKGHTLTTATNTVVAVTHRPRIPATQPDRAQSGPTPTTVAAVRGIREAIPTPHMYIPQYQTPLPSVARPCRSPRSRTVVIFSGIRACRRNSVYGYPHTGRKLMQR